MSFLQRTPFFRLLLSVITGILLYRWLEFPMWILYGLLLISISFISISFAIKNSFYEYKFRWQFGIGIFLFFSTLSYFLSYQTDKRNEFTHINQQGFFLVELSSSPIEKPRSYLCEVNILEFYDSLSVLPVSGKANVYFQKDSLITSLGYGDKLLMKTEFHPPQSMRNPDGFDYDLYLQQQGIYATCYVSSENWEIIGQNEKFSLLKTADNCRKYLLNIYRKYGIKDREYAVLAALTLGYKEELSLELRDSYSASGAMHILAVSGLHVGIIYAVLAFMLSFMNRSTCLRIWKTIILILFLWCYAFITGLSPSVLRATLMFSLVALGNLTGRKPQIYNTIFMSAFLLLLINPNLLYSVSFQLSYSAVVSIIYFQPKIAALFSIKNKILKWLWDLSAVSIAAQLGTAPFVLYYFQSFPNYFLLTNMIAIPAATLILYLAIALIIFSFIPVFALIIAQLLKATLFILNTFIEWIDNLPYAVSVIGVNTIQVMLLFLIIIFIGSYFHRKNYYNLIRVLSAILCFFFINLKIYYDTFNSQQFIVYESYRHTHVNLLAGRENFVYTTDDGELHRTASSFWNNKKILPPISMEEYPAYDNGFILFNNKKILILEEDYNYCISPEPISLDYLIIGNNLKPKINQLLEIIEPKMIICDNTISAWYTEQIKNACKKRKIAFYSTKESGAFIITYE